MQSTNLAHLVFFGLVTLSCDANVDLGNRGSLGGSSGSPTFEPGVGGNLGKGGTAAVGGQPATNVACGDGIVTSGEQCDDGNVDAGDGCSAGCAIEPGWTCAMGAMGLVCVSVCGDGIVTGREQCDDGTSNGADGLCTAQCRFTAVCGDGRITPGEQCDDGNTLNSDGCGGTCLVEPGWACPQPGQVCIAIVCGDGIVTAGEQCDDGVNNGGYGGCTPTCTFGPYCGDGIVDAAFGEQCDDGVNDGGYGSCAPGCKLGAHCGDGIVNGDEACDDGVGNGSSSECTRTCSIITVL
jgi:cysteine-rich repeat protein